MINTVTRVLHTGPGFNPDHLLTAEVRLTGDKYMDAMDQDKTGFNVINPPVEDFLPASAGAGQRHSRRRECGVGRLAAARRRTPNMLCRALLSQAERFRLPKSRTLFGILSVRIIFN